MHPNRWLSVQSTRKPQEWKWIERIRWRRKKMEKGVLQCLHNEKELVCNEHEGEYEWKFLEKGANENEQVKQLDNDGCGDNFKLV